MTFPPAQSYQDYASSKRGASLSTCPGVADWCRLTLLIGTTKTNKNQQLTAGRIVTEATKISRNPHNSTESAKVSKHLLKSSKIITNHHPAPSAVIKNHQ